MMGGVPAGHEAEVLCSHQGWLKPAQEGPASEVMHAIQDVNDTSSPDILQLFKAATLAL